MPNQTTHCSAFSLSPYLSIDPIQERVLILGQVAIAGAVLPGGRRGMRRASANYLPLLNSLPNFDLDDYLDAASNRRFGWQAALAEAAEALTDDSDLLILGIELCTNPMLYGDEAPPGILRRRMDAVLDVLESEFSCVDVQQTYEDVIVELAGVSGGSGWHGIIDSPITGAVASIHPLIGLPAMFGLKLLAGSEAETTPGQGRTLAQLARAVHVCRYAYTDQVQREAAARVRTQILDTWTAAEVSAEGRVTANALAALSELAGLTSTDTAIPDTKGMRLSDATRVLRVLQVTVSTEDDLKPGGTARTPFQEDNWIVVGQTVDGSGSSARLLVRKKTDPQR